MVRDKEHTFILSTEQVNAYLDWHEKMKKSKSHNKAGCNYSFIFTPTGLGDSVEVEHASGKKLDLSKYDLC